jgi:hypothetical protein
VAAAVIAFGALAAAARGAPQLAAATISGSCAPWDGPAFDVRIPTDDTPSASIVTVSIWRTARLVGPTVFRFPDATQTLGAATLLTHAGQAEQLAGSMSLGVVEEGKPVVGSIAFSAPGGIKINRSFRATWKTVWQLCGT